MTFLWAWRSRHRVLALMAVVVAAPLAGLVLVVGADNVPDRLVMDALFDAVEEGSLDEAGYGTGLAGHRVDQFTECVAITVGLGDEPGTTTVASAIRAPTLGPCPSSVPRIVGWAEGFGLERSYDYFRYWHGHTVVLRPLIAMFGVAGTRLVAAAVLLGVVAMLGRRITELAGRGAAVALVGPLVVTTDFVDLPRALPHAVSMALMLATAWWLLGNAARIPDLAGVALVTAVAGAAFVYVDILLNPDAAFAACVAAVGLAGAASTPVGVVVRRMSAAAGGWVVGYGSMWFAKWVIAATVVGIDRVRSDVIDQVDLRLQGDHPGLDVGVFGGVDRTMREWWSQPFTWAVVLGLAVWAMVAVVRRRRAREPANWSLRLALAAPSLVPPVWFSVMRNHTQVHAFFTYRSWALAIGILAVALVAPLDRVTSAPPESSSGRSSGTRPDGSRRVGT